MVLPSSPLKKTVMSYIIFTEYLCKPLINQEQTMSLTLYPLPDGAPQCDLYTIYINDQQVVAHAARVSAMPFNRNWPGHQRTLDQTEVIPFVSFNMVEPVHIRVITHTDYREAVLRPSSKGITPACRPRELSFTLSIPGQYSLEIDGTKGALQLFANPPAAYHIDETDENTLYFGPGIHHPGTINLQSGQTVYLHENAVVYGQIHAIDAENIRILGRGILDHSWIDAAEIPKNDNDKDVDPFRPSPVYLRYCKNVTIEGITVRDPAFLAVRPIACTNVDIDNIKIIGCWRYNSDGIDFINSLHCRARNCYVRSFDDSLNLKGFYFLHQGEMFHNGQCHAVMDDVIYENCVVWNEWGKALEVGVDLCAMEVKNCAFRNCDIIHCHGSSCMDISNVDYAHVHDITFENIRVEYDTIIQRPMIQKTDADIYPWDPHSIYMPKLFSLTIAFTMYSYGGTVRGHIDHVTFKNIQVQAPRMPPSVFCGYDDEHQVEQVRINGFSLNGIAVESLADSGITIGNFTCNVTLNK